MVRVRAKPAWCTGRNVWEWTDAVAMLAQKRATVAGRDELRRVSGHGNDRFETGEEVWLSLARCYGWIVERYDEEHWVVEVDGDDIPVHEDDLMPADQAPKREAAQAPASVPRAAEPEVEAYGTTASAPAFEPIAEPGLHLLLVPSGTSEGLMGRRLLVNNTAHAFAVSVEGLPGGTQHHNLDAGGRWSIGTWDGDALHGRPVVFATWRKLPNGGTDHAFRKELRIKASVFARRLAAWRNLGPPKPEGLIWTLFEDLPPKPKAKMEVPLPEGLRAERAVQNHRKHSAHGDAGDAFGHDWTDAAVPSDAGRNALAFANFPTDIDLHAEKLLPDPSKYEASEILAIQLDRARHFLERASALGLPRVYLIHGVGKGRLRGELGKMLQRHPLVHSHHHGYFAKYGFGATEVELG